MKPYRPHTDTEAKEEMFRLLRGASVAERFAMAESLTATAIARSEARD